MKTSTKYFIFSIIFLLLFLLIKIFILKNLDKIYVISSLLLLVISFYLVLFGIIKSSFENSSDPLDSYKSGYDYFFGIGLSFLSGGLIVYLSTGKIELSLEIIICVIIGLVSLVISGIFNSKSRNYKEKLHISNLKYRKDKLK